MTVGNMARMQLGMAQAQTKYGSQLDSWYNSYLSGSKLNKYGQTSNKKASQSLDELLKSNALKNKSDEFRSQFSDLYKNIFGIYDDDSADSGLASPQSIKTASAAAGNAAESIKAYANGLKYGGEVDVDSYKSYLQSFVDGYNQMIDRVGNSDNQLVLQKGVLMVNTGKVYSSALSRAGVTLGADNKLTVKDDLSGVRATDIKSLFGSMGFSDKVIQKAGQINGLTGGNGLFTANKVTSGNSTSAKDEYTDNAGTLKELSSKVKDLATAVKSYAQNLGTEENYYNPEDYSKLVTEFVDNYNNYISEAVKSSSSAVRNKGTTLTNTAQAYKYALQRAGINVDKNGKLSLADKDTLNKLTDRDIKYSFGSTAGGFLQKVTDKTDQINSLVSSASAMGYSSNKTATYAYNIGALFSMYA